MRALLPLSLLLLLTTGCGTLDVVQAGAVDPGEQPLPGGLPMTFDRLGGAAIALRPVRLPARRDLHRFGLTVVDTTSLGGFAPAHLVGPGAPRVVVSSVERSSPLAWAGLRPFDAVVSVDGQPVAGCDALLARLEAKAPGDVVRLEVVGPDGAARRLEAAGVESVHAASGFEVPLLCERQSSAAGSSLAIGPFDGLFWTRSVVLHWAVPPPRPQGQAPAPTPGSTDDPPFPPVADTPDPTELARPSRSRFTERTSWGTLWNLVTWEGERDLADGAERSRVRLLWVLTFGDELRDQGPLPGEAAP